MDNITILGTHITITESYEDAFNRLKLLLKTTGYITVNNVHTVVEATRNPGYKGVLNNSLLALPDGKPLSVYARVKGIKNINRIFGPTFMEKSIEWGQKDGLRHYFFGSSEQTLKKMILKVKEKYPQAIISGYFSPPFKEKFSEEENRLFVNDMNKSGADIFWIGLGAPKQEIWMFENYRKLNRGVMVGIGAGFDYLAGNIKHAPQWMKNSALEWLYRLIQEPRRLWKRYLVTNTLFLFFIFLELSGIKKFTP